MTLSLLVIIIFILLFSTHFNYLSSPPGWLDEAAHREYVDYMYHVDGMENIFWVANIVQFLNMFALLFPSFCALFLYNEIMNIKSQRKSLFNRIFVGIIASVLIKIILFIFKVRFSIYMNWINNVIFAVLILEYLYRKS